MKKLSYLFATLIMVAALFSCEQDESDIMLKKADVAKKTDSGATATAASSTESVTPVIIPGANNGGNRTCAEVAAYFGLPDDYFLCGDRVDYNGGVFAGNFPDGVLVDVTHGTYVDFELDAPIQIGDKFYVVGAVIVKGGNAANVYFYPDGSMGDSGLTAPVNASGKAAGLSNLTFCLTEQVSDLVIAVKTYLAEPLDTDPITYVEKAAWAVSGGLGVSTEYGLHMGYNYYKYGIDNQFDLVEATLDEIIGPIGKIEASDYWEGEDHYLEVVLTLDEETYMFGNSYLYVGSYDGYDGLYFEDFPFQVTDDITAPRVFKINFNEIIN